MHTVFALLCFVVVIHWLIIPYPSGLLHWHCGNLTIAPVPAKQPWWIWINTSCQFIMNDCITTTKQSTTKPCAYFLGYTVDWSGTNFNKQNTIKTFEETAVQNYSSNFGLFTSRYEICTLPRFSTNADINKGIFRIVFRRRDKVGIFFMRQILVSARLWWRSMARLLHLLSVSLLWTTHTELLITCKHLLCRKLVWKFRPQYIDHLVSASN